MPEKAEDIAGLVRQITVTRSTLRGETDSYSVAAGQNAMAIMGEVIQSLREEGIYREDVKYRIFTPARIGKMLTTGTDRDEQSARYWIDPSLPVGDITFVDGMPSVQATLAGKLDRMKFYGDHFFIAVYSPEGFNVDWNYPCPLVLFKDKEPEKRRQYLIRIYEVHLTQKPDKPIS